MNEIAGQNHLASLEQVAGLAKRAAAGEEITAKPETAFFPELLAPITPADAGRYIVSDDWEMEEKLDGHRYSVLADGLFLSAYNRKGERVPLPSRDLEALRGHTDVHLDGEFLNGRFVAFDILNYEGIDVRDHTRDKRRGWLRLAHRTLPPCFDISRSYLSAVGKETALLKFQKDRAEGVVFKRRDAPYMPGRKGVNVKLKFWASATLRVCKKPKDDGHASFAVEAWKGRKGEPYAWNNVGSVTLTKTKEIPETGTFREVKYLYLGVGGRLYQPEDLGPRVDVDESDCGFAQLKRKGGGE